MIALDTNFMSALMRRDVDQIVIEWLDGQPPASIWTTAVTVFEICFDLEVLVDGRRRRQLEDAFARVLENDLKGRVLSFEQTAAQEAASIAARRRQVGRPVEIRDAQIAGVVAAKRATLATRNTRLFADLGITLVEPWVGR